MFKAGGAVSGVDTSTFEFGSGESVGGEFGVCENVVAVFACELRYQALVVIDIAVMYSVPCVFCDAIDLSWVGSVAADWFSTRSWLFALQSC